MSPSQVKERPILFSGEMVRAILDGRKTQTRRAMKPQLIYGDIAGTFASWSFPLKRGGALIWPNARQSIVALCRYGVPGDHLWVRETFAIEHQVESDQSPPFNDGRPIQRGDALLEKGWRQPHYRATDPEPELSYEEGCSPRCPVDGHVHWTPSIHMPRWASRITLEVTNVRVERLQNITEDDAKAEGCNKAAPRSSDYDIPAPTYRYGYSMLWDLINGADSWAANPWVWVVEFKKL